MTAPLLRVEGLTVDYPAGRRGSTRAVDAVDLDIDAGQTVGLVGESGSGKSTIGRAVLGLAPITAGRILFDGQDVADLRRRHGTVDGLQVVFQDPYSSLDPTKTIGWSVAQPLVTRRGRAPGRHRPQVRDEVLAMLERVGLPASSAGRYPAQFSGGQRQRVAIARALITEPRLVICDEVVSALDLSVQAQVINLLADLQAERGLAYLFIGHDLDVVEHLSDHLVVLYRGRVLETGDARQVNRTPAHPYTRALVASAPVSDPAAQQLRRAQRESLKVVPRRAAPLGESCPFEHRCPIAEQRCRDERPALRVIGPGRRAACHLVDTDDTDDAVGAASSGLAGGGS